MKISYNWLKSYLDFDLNPTALEHWLTALGLEVEGMENYESIPGGLRGIVTGEVLTKAQHPNADRLSVTTVDVGGDEPLHIVCGAPNVDKGQKVLVATVGTELHTEEGESFTIKKSKIRGEQSAGMICAEDELGLGKSHEGIMVLDPETKIGLPASELFPVESDTIYEIGLTPNRSDATAHLGAARDLAAGLGYHEGQKKTVKTPQVKRETNGSQQDFTVQVENAEACPRYAGLLIDNIQVGESPDWLKTRLIAIGVKTISNVVDITNFVLHEFGQPLHAFDRDKIKGNGIIVKTMAKDTQFLTLDEVERKLDETDLMICDAESNPMCIAGVFGGIHSGVTDSTTSIFLESAHFDAEYVRKTSMRHGLRTDAAKVFEKGSDPNIADEALWRAANLMTELCGATVAEPVFDLYPTPILKKSVQVKRSHVNRLIGIDLSDEDLRQIFDHLNFTIDSSSDDTYEILIPTDKTDVTREADVIEEILRIYGYDRVPVSSKLRTSLVHADGLALHEWRDQIAQKLTAKGYHQMMNLSLSRSAYYDDNREDLVYILNTSNSHLDIMRPDMIHSALETVAHNVKYQNRNIRLFEFGSAYSRADGDYVEDEKLSIIATGDTGNEHWRVKPLTSDYYEMKGLLSAILPSRLVDKMKFEELTTDLLAYGHSIVVHGKSIGFIGRLASSLTDRFDVDSPVFYAELNVNSVFQDKKQQVVTYSDISKYPGTQRDMALIVDEKITFEEIQRVIDSVKNKRIRNVSLFDIYRNDDHIGPDKKSMGVRIDFMDETKTLSDKEVDKMIKKLLGSFKHHLGAELR